MTQKIRKSDLLINPRRLIISTRGHKMGDVIFSLPIATLLKQRFPDIVIGFIGTSYTKAIIEACSSIDFFIEKHDFLTQTITLNGLQPDCLLHVIPNRQMAKRAKELKIPLRIATNRRLYHWLTCNKLVPLKRRNSLLHEIQLNLEILKAFDMKYQFSLSEIPPLYALPELASCFTHSHLLAKNKFKLIIHPKSGGSAKEWHLQRYIELIELLDADKFQIFISGSSAEKMLLQPLFEKVGHKVTNICGQLDLNEFTGLVASCDALIACSTGPLHLVAALGKYALGIYAPRSPIFARRWGPVGKNAHVFALENSNCHNCVENDANCLCMDTIEPQQIKQALDLIYTEFYKQGS